MSSLHSIIEEEKVFLQTLILIIRILPTLTENLYFNIQRGQKDLSHVYNEIFYFKNENNGGLARCVTALMKMNKMNPVFLLCIT